MHFVNDDWMNMLLHVLYLDTSPLILKSYVKNYWDDFLLLFFFLRNIRRTTHFPKSLIVQILENTCYIRNTVLYLESVLKRRVMFIRQTCHWEKASMCLLLHTSSWPIVDIEFRIHESATKKEPQQWPRKVARIHKKREILAIYVTSIRLHFVFSNLKLMKQWCSIVCCIVNIAC